MIPRFLDACLVEIDEAAEWYERQSPELPERLLDEVHEAVARLWTFPQRFRMVVPPHRRVMLSSFPYSIFFRIDPDEIVLVAFFDQRSDPAKWTEVLRGR